MITAYLRKILDNAPDPEWNDLKDFNRQKMDLERFWVECVCCGGSVAMWDGAATDRLLVQLERFSKWDMDRLSPIKLIRNASTDTGPTGNMTAALSAAIATCDLKVALYGNIGDMLKEQLIYSTEMFYAGQPDIREATFVELMGFKRISKNVAATFCFYSGLDPEVFPIDTPVLHWLTTLGYDVEASDAVDVCQLQMMIALQEVDRRVSDRHEAYRMIWDNYHFNNGEGNPFAQLLETSE